MQAQHGLLQGAANGNLTGQGAGGGAGQDQGALDEAVAANGDQAQGSYRNLLQNVQLVKGTRYVLRFSFVFLNTF